MQQTANFQLSQWASTDRILMEDFNNDNAKIDAALKAEQTAREALAQAVAKCGNCRIYTTTYTGTGTYGSGNPNSLTFPGKPLFVLITDTASGSVIYATYGAATIYSRASGAAIQGASWSGNTMTWYNPSAAESQLNAIGKTYSVLAFMAAEA